MTTRRSRGAAILLIAAVAAAVCILAYFTLRTAFQLEKLRKQSVLEATLALASEKADRLDRRIVEEDNVVFSIVDPGRPYAIEEQWLPTAQRETPTIRAVLVLDEHLTVRAFASRATGPWADEESFRRLLVHRMVADMDLARSPPEELRHLHHEYGGQTYLVSYWAKLSQGRRYYVVAWHDVGRIVREVLPTLYSEGAGTTLRRANVVDEDGRTIFGPPLRSGEFTVGVRFPTTLYNWRLQVSPAAGDDLADRVQNRRLLEIFMVLLSAVVVLAGVITFVIAAEHERRASALKSEFVANVSHELKTPLALIRMFGEMLQSNRVANEAKRNEYLEIIVRESDRLSALIENVLDFARVERGREAFEFVEGDLGHTVQKAANVYGYRAEREGTRIEVVVAPNLPPVRFDERAIQLAVINLVDNALKYAAGSPTIQIRVDCEGPRAVVRVKDSGPGIPREAHQRIFDRFVRGHSPHSEMSAPPVRGTGIGLSLVKHIAESHGGRAWVESTVGQGSTFLFTLPLPSRSTGRTQGPPDRDVSGIEDRSPPSPGGEV